MATDVSIAIRTEAALQSLTESALRLSVKFGTPPLVFPNTRRDNENDVRQIEAIADYLATLSGSKGESPMHRDTTKYELMSEGDLLRVATDRGLIGRLGPERDELIAMLRAADNSAAASDVSVAPAPSADKTPAAYLARSAQRANFDGLSKDDIIADAREAGMKVTSRTTRDEAIDYLMAANGISEDQQASIDDADVDDDDESAG